MPTLAWACRAPQRRRVGARAHASSRRGTSAWVQAPTLHLHWPSASRFIWPRRSSEPDRRSNRNQRAPCPRVFLAFALPAIYTRSYSFRAAACFSTRLRLLACLRGGKHSPYALCIAPPPRSKTGETRQGFASVHARSRERISGFVNPTALPCLIELPRTADLPICRCWSTRGRDSSDKGSELTNSPRVFK